MDNYTIVEDKVWACRLVEVLPKKNFIVLKFGKYNNGEILFSLIRNDFESYQFYKQDMLSKQRHTIHRVCLESKVGVYHKYTWTDVDKKICTHDHVGEVQRDDKGNPIVWKRIVIFENFENLKEPLAANLYFQDYVEVNSPYAAQALNYNNRHSYASRCQLERERREEEKEDAYYQMMDEGDGGYNDGCSGYEWTDEDAWDAMTDGQYGDYPGPGWDPERWGF